MSFLSNLKLAREDDEILADGAGEPAEIDVTEAIQAEEDNLEVQETEVAIEEEQEQIEVQSEVVEELQEQDAAIEEKLESPAEVTPEDVAVAQEAFAFTLGRLAGNSSVYKEYKNIKVSYEDAKTDPVSALKLHREGIKDVMKSVWESLKTMFAKILSWCKKIYTKIIAIFTDFEKKAKALKDKVDNTLTIENSKASDLAKKHIPFAGVVGESKVGEVPAGVAAFVKSLSVGQSLFNKIGNEIAGFKGDVGSGSATLSVNNIEGAIKTVADVFATEVSPYIALADKAGGRGGVSILEQAIAQNYAEFMGGFISEELKLKSDGKFSYTAKLAAGAGVVVAIPYYIDGSGIHFVLCKITVAAGGSGSVDNHNATVSAGAGFTWDFKPAILKYKDDFVKGIGKLPSNGADVHYILDALINYGKVKKEIVSGSEKLSSAANKILDAFGKLQSAGEDILGKNKAVTAMTKSFMNFGKLAVANLTTMVIKQYLYIGKAYLSYANALITKEESKK